MDVLFAEALEFCLPHGTIMRCRVAPSQEEVLRQMMAEVGIELIDYGSFTVRPIEGFAGPGPLAKDAMIDLVLVYSRAYRERREREAMSFRG